MIRCSASDPPPPSPLPPQIRKSVNSLVNGSNLHARSWNYIGNDGDDACALCNHVCHLLWHRIGRPTRGSQRDLRIVGWDLRIIGYVRHGVWRQTKVLSKQRVLGHDAQLPAITYNHFGTYIHMYHGSGNDFTDLRIYPPPSPSSRLGPRHGPPNQVTAGCCCTCA